MFYVTACQECFVCCVHCV